MIPWKCCTQYASKFGKLSSGHKTGKGQFSFQSQRKAMPKNAQITAKLHSSHMLISKLHASHKVMLKIFQARLNSMWTMKFQMFKLDLKKAEEPDIKLPTSSGSSKKQESSRKTSISALLTMPKPLCESQQTVEKFLKRWEHQTTLLASWEICMQVKKQQLNWIWNKGLFPNRGRSTPRLYIVTLLV